MKFESYTPVNNIYLLETDTPKIKETEYQKSEGGIFIGRENIVEAAKYIGTIVKKGPKCNNFKIGDVINYYPDSGLEHTFDDKTNKYVLIKDENFLGKIVNNFNEDESC